MAHVATATSAPSAAAAAPLAGEQGIIAADTADLKARAGVIFAAAQSLLPPLCELIAGYAFPLSQRRFATDVFEAVAGHPLFRHIGGAFPEHVEALLDCPATLPALIQTEGDNRFWIQPEVDLRWLSPRSDRDYIWRILDGATIRPLITRIIGDLLQKYAKIISRMTFPVMWSRCGREITIHLFDPAKNNRSMRIVFHRSARSTRDLFWYRVFCCEQTPRPRLTFHVAYGDCYMSKEHLRFAFEDKITTTTYRPSLNGPFVVVEGPRILVSESLRWTPYPPVQAASSPSANANAAAAATPAPNTKK